LSRLLVLKSLYSYYDFQLLDAGAQAGLLGAQKRPGSSGGSAAKLFVDRSTPVATADTRKAPTDGLVALVGFGRVELSTGGRVDDVMEMRKISSGFQLADEPNQVLTAGHCVEMLPPAPKIGQLARSEASHFFALSYKQFRSLKRYEWFDMNRLQQVGAQEVVRFKSEYPPSAEQLQNRLKGNMDVYGASDAALLQLSGPLKGVVGLKLAPRNVMFRPGAPFLAIGLPKRYECSIGVSPMKAPRIAVYSAFQDLQDPVTLFADEETFDLSSMGTTGFSGGPLCARVDDILPASLLDVFARPILAVLPILQPPVKPSPPPSTRLASELRTAVDPVTREEMTYPAGEFAQPLAVLRVTVDSQH
jgi:hypothetical protein